MIPSRVSLKLTEEVQYAPPPWMAEVAIVAQVLASRGVLTALGQVHEVRSRCGHYVFLDFAAVLLGYALSGERTLEAFFGRLAPWASEFMALFGREMLPS